MRFVRRGNRQPGRVRETAGERDPEPLLLSLRTFVSSVRSSDTRRATSPLDHAVRMIDGRKLLPPRPTASWCRNRIIRMSRSEAEDFIARCRWGSPPGQFVLRRLPAWTEATCSSQAANLLPPGDVGSHHAIAGRTLPGCLTGMQIDDLPSTSHAISESARTFCESLLLLRPPENRPLSILPSRGRRSCPTVGIECEVVLRQEVFDVARGPRPEIAIGAGGARATVSSLRGRTRGSPFWTPACLPARSASLCSIRGRRSAPRRTRRNALLPLRPRAPSSRGHQLQGCPGTTARLNPAIPGRQLGLGIIRIYRTCISDRVH